MHPADDNPSPLPWPPARHPVIGRLTAALAALGVSGRAAAHGMPQRYELPVPLDLYLGSAAAVVALSFVLLAWLFRDHRAPVRFPQVRVWSGPAGPIVTTTLALLRVLGVSLLALILVAGFAGNPDPFHNIAPTFIWIIWWVGLAYLCALLGNLWAPLNPWASVARVTGDVYRRLAGSASTRPLLPWPARLGQWPAVLLFAWFVWAELIWPASDAPREVAQAILGYSLITWAGMLVFGRRTWLTNGEAFSVAFGLIARFAPFAIGVRDGEACATCTGAECSPASTGCANCLDCFDRAALQARELALQPYAVGLLPSAAFPVPLMVFVLLMLSSVTFDGLLATPLWAVTADWMIHARAVRPLLIGLQDITGNAIAAAATVALCVFLVSFQLIYLAFCGLMRAALPAKHRRQLGLLDLARWFVPTLLPIALAYHLAHYLSYLAIAGQYIIPLASDPLGYGWNLFGTRLYMLDVGIVTSRSIWVVCVTAIVIGHVIAVWLAHVTALRLFGTARAALRSQVPMTILMVGYTMLSLWILAQPIVETR